MWEKYTEIIVACIAMVSSIITIYIKYLLDERKKSKDNIVLDSFDGDRAVLDKLGALLDNIEADRVYIIEYHNGGKFYTGRSMQKFSMTYEICRSGVSHEQVKYQNILNSVWHEAIKLLIDEKAIIIPDVVNYTKSDQLKSLYLDKGSLSVYGVPIYDLNEKLIGTLCVNYTRNKKMLGEVELDQMKRVADILSGYL